MVLLKESQEKQINLFFKLEKAADKIGLQCNKGKTAYMSFKKTGNKCYYGLAKILALLIII